MRLAINGDKDKNINPVLCRYYYYPHLVNLTDFEMTGEFGAYWPPENGIKNGILCWILYDIPADVDPFYKISKGIFVFLRDRARMRV